MDSVAKMIDHTNLKAFAQKKDIEKLCQEAKEHGFASVCVNSVWVKTAAALLAGTDSQGHHVKTCTVVGFPLGAMSHEAKAFETTQAVNDGAEEIDMVIDIGAAKDGRWDDVKRDISGIVKAAKEKNALVKVILENCYLTKEEIEKACLCCVECGADFVKTSTGFGTGGATPEDVALMKKTVNGKALVKAAGGIRDKDSAQKMIDAGADRLGCSAGIAIVAG